MPTLLLSWSYHHVQTPYLHRISTNEPHWVYIYICMYPSSALTAHLSKTSSKKSHQFKSIWSSHQIHSQQQRRYLQNSNLPHEGHQLHFVWASGQHIIFRAVAICSKFQSSHSMSYNALRLLPAFRKNTQCSFSRDSQVYKILTAGAEIIFSLTWIIQHSVATSLNKNANHHSTSKCTAKKLPEKANSPSRIWH